MRTPSPRGSLLAILAGNSGWSLLVHAIRVASLLVVTILLARHLGPTEFGVFAVAFSIVKIFSVLAALGLERIVVKRIVQGSGIQIVGRVVRLRLIGGLFAYVLAVATAAALNPSTPGVLGLVVAMGASLILQSASTCDFVFQAESRIRLTAIASAPPFLLSALVKILAIILGAPLVVFAWLELLESALLGVGMVITYFATRRETGDRSNSVQSPTSRALLREALPLLLASLTVILYMRSDLLLLGILLDTEAVGIYSAAAQLSEVWSILPVALVPAILPAFLAIKKRDSVAFHSALLQLYGVAAAGACFIAVAVTVLAPWLIACLFGARYADATPVLRVHIWAVVFIYLGMAQSIWNLSENRLWLNLVRTASGALLNIVLNLALIPRFGPVGAAIATLVSYSASAVWLNGLSQYTRGVLKLQLRALLIVPFLFDLREYGLSRIRSSAR